MLHKLTEIHFFKANAFFLALIFPFACGPFFVQSPGNFTRMGFETALQRIKVWRGVVTFTQGILCDRTAVPAKQMLLSKLILMIGV